MTSSTATARTTATRATRPNSSTRRRLLATILHHLGSDCAACGRETIVGGSPLDGRTLNLGHIVADANGGKWAVDNLLPICRRCNVWMGDQNWVASGAPMRVDRLPAGTPLLPDTGDRETHMSAPEWAI